MNNRYINSIVSQALKEDLAYQDITTNILVEQDHLSEAYILLKEDAIISGMDLLKAVFKKLDRKIQVKYIRQDGEKVRKNTKIAFLKGKTRSLLKGERTALNFLQYLSGIATNTSHFVQKVKPFKPKILDTRKTTPGLRRLEKYAVRCGGGHNHRFTLKEMILIKDNHREICHPEMSTRDVIEHIKKKTKKIIGIEVDNLFQLKEALATRPSIILLDNMSIEQMKKAVAMTKKAYSGTKRVGPRPLLEASGGITLRSVRKVAETGVDRISIGSLTHTHKAIDISMEIIR